MQKIILKKSKTLYKPNNVQLFKGENNVDSLEIYIPQTYNGIDLSTCNVRLKYILSDGSGNSFLIDGYKQDNLYKEQIVYLIPIDTRFTSVSGKIEICFTITKPEESNPILKSTSTYIYINEQPEGTTEITEEELDIIDQVVLISNKALKTAENIEQRADNGEFDGSDGYTPVKGLDYFTEAEIEQIEQGAADKVPLEDYVQTTRTIAGIDLEDDIADVELSRALLPRLLHDSTNTPLFASTVTQYINNNTNVSANTSARHTHDNKEFLDGLSQETLEQTVEDVGGELTDLKTDNKTSYVNAINEVKDDVDSIKPYWKLIRRIKITEDVATMTITTDSEGKPFKCNRIKIIMPKLYLSGTANIFNYFKDSSGKNFNFMASTSVPTDTKADWTAQIINSEYIYMEAIIRRGTDAASATSLVRENYVETDGIVTGIYILCEANFTAGTEILIYGGYDE